MVSIVRVDSKYDDIDGKLQMFCESASSDSHLAARNMEYFDWENRPETLMNQIFKQKVYDDGGYFLLEENDMFTAGAGFYPFEFDKNIAVSPVRLYVIPTMSDYKRIKKMSYVPSKFFKTHIQNNFKGLVTFANEYNAYGIKYALKAGSDRWIMNGSVNFKLFDESVIYKHTPQQAIYASWQNYEKEIEKCLKKIENI